MTDSTASAVTGTITLDPGDDPQAAWPRICDLGRASGLRPLRAARLALAVTSVVGQSHGPIVVEIARVQGAHSAHVAATIHAGNASLASAPPGLVDTSRRDVSAAGTVTRVLTVNIEEDAVTGDPPSVALSVAAAQSPATRQLLVAVLAAVPRQASRAEGRAVERAVEGAEGRAEGQAVGRAQGRAVERAEGVDSEVRALRLELDQSNQGLLALHAELSDRQDELELARAVAERANVNKADFLANMSHEIRSPMNAVVGFNRLLRATELTPEQVEYTEAVDAAGKHLLGLIDDILDLSKIESGLLELEDIPFDVFRCVEDAVDLVSARASEKNLALAALFAPGMPASIIGDPLRLRQILVNLLANAIKFTNHGHVVVEVTELSAAGNSRQLAFAVRDTGSGIPADRLELLFAPYAQADASTARFHGGTGLGLTICRQLAERMGGAIMVDSTVGEGSIFTCTISTRVAAPTLASPGNDVTLSGTQVLVVDGRPLYAQAIGRHLKDWGAQVVTASSFDAAISRSGDWSDAALAIIDASAATTVAGDIARLTAAAANPALPVICVTAMASRAALASYTDECGLSVRTPIRREHLRTAVLAALGRGGGSPRAGAADPTADAGPDSTGETPVRAVPPSPRRVLYVDDNPMLTMLVDRIFAADPAVAVQTAPDGATGLRLAAQQQPDIVLLDLQLSDMSGEALLRQLRSDARTRSIPAVIVSGDTSPATIERLITLGAVAYLTKPFTATQLREVVATASRPAESGSPPAG